MLSKNSALLIVTVLSFFTYAYRYQNPPFFFWDENYHIASAQKYLNGVYFMEAHPPLGKMLIALGEKIIHANPENNQFIGTDYGKDLPKDFSFAGYRFFPTMFAWLAVPLFFLILFTLTTSVPFALFGTFPILFDNALIVHSRSAMLEPIQIFFLLVGVLIAAKSKDEPFSWTRAIYFGLATGLAVATKLNGLIGLIFLPLLIYRASTTNKIFSSIAILVSTAFVPLLIWSIHILWCTNVVTTLPDNGFYKANETYKKVLTAEQPWTAAALASAVSDHIHFIQHYNKGVPALNLCKDGENGSSPLLWPFGARSINYRWERANNLTRYLYLQANPFAWLVSFLGVCGGVCFLISRIFGKEKLSFDGSTIMITLLVAGWFGYMSLMLQLGRVMYLYHYFIPLVFGFLLFPLVWQKLAYFNAKIITTMQKNVVLAISSVLIVAGFIVFAPFSYYQPLTDAEVADRSWLKVWDLRCQNCKPINDYARPIVNNK